MSWLRQVVATVVLSVTTLYACGGEFDGLGIALREMHRAGNSDVSLQITKKAILITGTKRQDIAPEKAKALLAARTPGGGITLRFSKNGDWLVFQLPDKRSVAMPVGEKGKAQTARQPQLEWQQTFGRFALARWAAFVEHAAQNGLSGVQEASLNAKDAGDKRWITLWFAPRTPPTLTAGKVTLNLTPGFGATMRLSPHYPGEQGANGFVLLLHDPHSDLAGRYQTLAGLRHLIEPNKPRKFDFLVEGLYQDPSRKITLADLYAGFSEPPTPPVVHRMLAEFLINTPTAYRLMYDRNIEGYAIDDNSHLQYANPHRLRDPWEQAKSLEAIARGTIGDAAVPAEYTKAIEILFVYMTADVQGQDDATTIRHLKNLSEFCGQVSEAGKALVRGGTKLDRKALDELAADAQAYGEEAKVYQHARDRNRTIAEQIIIHAKQLDKVSIAFIGNYHTPGVTEMLRDAGIGYSVIEPRPRQGNNRAEQEAFKKANHTDTRGTYWGVPRTNMGYNEPTKAEMLKLAPVLARWQRDAHSTIDTTRSLFKKLEGSAVDLPKLEAALKSNCAIGGYPVRSGAGDPPPPVIFGKAFAYFEPERNNNGKAGLVLMDPRSERWQAGDHYAFLSVALMKTPGKNEIVTVQKTVTLYPDLIAGHTYFTVYDAASGRVYAFDGKPTAIANLVGNPIGNEKYENNIRLQVVQFLRSITGGSNG